MSAKTFLVPQHHLLAEILCFGNELDDYSESSDQFIFDFQGSGLDTPFGMLYIASAIKKFMKQHPKASFTPLHFAEREYAAYMGFFHACGFETGKKPGHSPGSNTHIPIKVLPIAEFVAQARTETREVGDVIEEYSRRLSTILLQEDTGDAVNLLSYTFREMIRNAAEHSGANEVVICAQYMKRKKQAELAILDTGMGVYTSLSNNPHLQLQNDRDALNLALMPGISGKHFKGARRNPYDVWQNSGLGLYGVSRLCGHGGKFSICSGDTALALKPNGKEYHPTSFQGTALRIILSAKEITNTKATLAKIMKEGDKQAKELGNLDLQGSTASKMLSNEFKMNKD